MPFTGIFTLGKLIIIDSFFFPYIAKFKFDI